jgi:hypothetical protein
LLTRRAKSIHIFCFFFFKKINDSDAGKKRSLSVSNPTENDNFQRKKPDRGYYQPPSGRYSTNQNGNRGGTNANANGGQNGNGNFNNNNKKRRTFSYGSTFGRKNAY